MGSGFSLDRARMEPPLAGSAEEIQRLRRCVNDLGLGLAVAASPSGDDAARIVRVLADLLLDMLGVDFVYVRITDAAGGAPTEGARFARAQTATPSAQELGKRFQSWLGGDSARWPATVPDPVGMGEVSIVALPLARDAGSGSIVAGAKRTDFPRDTERLLLSVAANQAASAVRAAELAQANAALRAELA